MPQWVYILAFAQAQLRKIEQKQALFILFGINRMREPNADIKPLAGFAPLLRLRVARYRVIFHEHTAGQFNIHDVGFRRDVYQRLASTWKRYKESESL